ncbi:uncharacterized mitochondrial protein AtMg00810-like [Solanum dulcamara]|uniref:uncharacterized mitochondrial protein AtMg00810-like n=1 Tax=Solanum dulcamara TaxID=45834 RepID=UPI002484F6D3|nr:uncharacterized mitochondrial protein AtMg00810-like [Solanum dulcamara]
MHDAKVHDTPIATTTKLDKNVSGSPAGDTKYRAISGSLVYLTTSRLDIMFSVGLCARFQSWPKESYMKTVKQILPYLKGTLNLVLWYPISESFDLIGFVDTDYAEYLMDRKNTLGMSHFLGSYLVFWKTRKQNSIALSTAEVEYMATAS